MLAARERLGALSTASPYIHLGCWALHYAASRPSSTAPPPPHHLQPCLQHGPVPQHPHLRTTNRLIVCFARCRPANSRRNPRPTPSSPFLLPPPPPPPPPPPLFTALPHRDACCRPAVCPPARHLSPSPGTPQLCVLTANPAPFDLVLRVSPQSLPESLATADCVRIAPSPPSTGRPPP